MEYKDLEVWQPARESVNRIHRMALRELPKFEMHEEGTQIRRFTQSVETNQDRFCEDTPEYEG